MTKQLLRTAFLFVICNLSFIIGKAQWVSIPDTNFGTWLNASGYWQCMQGNSMVGWQMDTTCPAVVNDTHLYCDSRSIRDLTGIQYFDNLQLVDCHNNELSSLPALSNSLRTLYCPTNQLSSLPVLPDSLTNFSCFDNQLSNLPVLPNSLVTLICNNNQLTNIPALPNSLIYFYCNDNQLNNLPVLPNSLRTFYCNDNQLTSLPALPNSLIHFYCNDNQLSSLPELPDSLNVFFCFNNPNLFCLPQLKKIRDFKFSNTGITCLPNYPQSNTSSSPVLSTVPLCDTSSYNIFGCAAHWNILSKVYQDTSMNCLYDVGENTFGNLKIQLYQNGVLEQQIYSPQSGVYSINTDLSTYQYSVDTSNLPFTVACPDSGYYTSTITALDSFDADMNFGLRCKLGFDLVAQSISATGFRPANITKVNISVGDASNFYGAHCVGGVNGSVQLIINGSAHYSSPASGALTPTSVLNDTITWSIADFGAVSFFKDFNINVATDTTAALGSQICFTLIVYPIDGDNNGKNNFLTHCFTVVGSYDPNEKEVYPAGNIDTATHWLTYTIHFQNTGTAEAQHIYLTDTLDSNIDAGSFQLLAYSHQPMVQLKGNNLRFNFPNINLPDSNTNEPLSHGYVQYKVKLKNNLSIGTNINNTAFIYFDFNAPVVTNTTSNTITSTTGISSFSTQHSYFSIYPNPANESVRVSIDESMIGSTLIINDITGRQVTAVQLQTKNIQLQTDNLSQGVYFVSLETKTGKMTKKLVIER